MKRTALFLLGALVLTGVTGCMHGWNHDAGGQVLAPARPADKHLESASRDPTLAGESRRLQVSVPAGWHWFARGDGLIATRDGVFLQQIVVERLRVDQVDQDDGGMSEAISSRLWPVRTAKNQTKRFAADMRAIDAAEVLLESRRNDPGVVGLRLRNLATRTLAGRQAFRVEFDFRLPELSGEPWPPYRSTFEFSSKESAGEPWPSYRAVYSGFVIGDWFYGTGYTAAQGYYFDRDAGTFEAFLETVRVLDQ